MLSPLNIFEIDGLLTNDTVVWTITVTSNVANPDSYIQLTYDADFAYVSHTASAGTTYDDGTKQWQTPFASAGTYTLEITMTFTPPVSLEEEYDFVADIEGPLADTLESNNVLTETLTYRVVSEEALAGPNDDFTACTCFDVSTNDTPCTTGTTEYRLNVGSETNLEVITWDETTGQGHVKRIDTTINGTLTYDLYCVTGSGDTYVRTNVLTIYPDLKDKDTFDHIMEVVVASELTPAEYAEIEALYPDLTPSTNLQILRNNDGDITSFIVLGTELEYQAEYYDETDQRIILFTDAAGNFIYKYPSGALWWSAENPGGNDPNALSPTPSV